MGDAYEVLRLKTRQYLGPVLTNRRKLVRTIPAFVAFTLFALPIGFEFVGPQGAFPMFMDVESASAILSIFLTFSFVQGLAGGVMAHPSEIDFVLTTPIRPRRYMLAEYGFQFLMFGLFLQPALAGFSAGVTIGTGEPVRGLLVLAAAEIFLMLPGLITQSIGIVSGTNHRWVARGIVVSAALVLLLPALHFVVPFPFRYADFVGPPQLVASVVFGIARHGVLDGLALLGLAGFVGAAASAWFVLSGREFFPGVRPLLIMSFGQPMDFSQMVRLAAERKARRTRLAVDVFRTSLSRTMTKLQVARWTRSGLLPAGIAMLGVLGFMGLVFASGMPGGASFVAATFSFVPILLPSFLLLPTMTFERDRLWAYTIIPGGMSKFVQALFASQIAVAVPIVTVAPAIVMILTDSFAAPPLAALAGAAVGSAWAATLLLTKIEIPLDTFSLRPLLFLGACGLGALPLSFPAVVFGGFFAGDLLGSIGFSLAYAVGLVFAGTLAYRWIGRAAKTFDLYQARQSRPSAGPLAASEVDIKRAYGILAKGTFVMILYAFVFLLAAMQPVLPLESGPPPPMPLYVDVVTAILGSALVLAPVLIVVLLSIGYRRLVRRAIVGMPAEAVASARTARRWFQTFWGLIGVAIPVFFASFAAMFLSAPDYVQMSLYLVFVALPSALLIALVLFLAYAARAVVPSPRRGVLHRLVLADVLLVCGSAAGNMILTAASWHDLVGSGVLSPVSSPWTTVPSGAFNIATLIALYLTFRWARRHPSLPKEPGAAIPVAPSRDTSGERSS